MKCGACNSKFNIHEAPIPLFTEPGDVFIYKSNGDCEKKKGLCLKPIHYVFDLVSCPICHASLIIKENLSKC